MPISSYISQGGKKMKEKTNIIITGVGGQGVITAANIIGKAALKAKLTVFVSETHGMAQRGGSVNCTVRIGNITGPLVPTGGADVILSTEPIEALRYIKYSNKDTKIIIDSTPVIPFTVSIGSEKYPKLILILKELEKYGKLYYFNAVKIAKDAGALVTKNIVMLGALAASNVLPFKSEILLETILENVPKKYIELNKKAYKEGYKAIKKI
jgi:indolepyruvate ferredoxin oxidoreductase beta subunit